MLKLLTSNYEPVNMGCQSFEKTFFDYFNRSVKLTAASGYISEDAIADLLMLYKTGARTQLELIVGMHYFDGFSQGQFTSLCDLHSVLQKIIWVLYIFLVVLDTMERYIFLIQATGKFP